jgi:hypothetical protein
MALEAEVRFLVRSGPRRQSWARGCGAAKLFGRVQRRREARACSPRAFASECRRAWRVLSFRNQAPSIQPQGSFNRPVPRTPFARVQARPRLQTSHQNQPNNSQARVSTFSARQTSRAVGGAPGRRRRPSNLLRGQASCPPANLSSASTVHLAGSLLGGGSDCAGSGVDMSATDASPDSSRLRAACCGLLGCCATRWLELAGSWRSVAMARVVSGSGWRKCSCARALGPCGAAGEPSNATLGEDPSFGRCGAAALRWRGAGSSVAPLSSALRCDELVQAGSPGQARRAGAQSRHSIARAPAAGARPGALTRRPRSSMAPGLPPPAPLPWLLSGVHW